MVQHSDIYTSLSYTSEFWCKLKMFFQRVVDRTTETTIEMQWCMSSRHVFSNGFSLLRRSILYTANTNRVWEL
jgi:hypothetical protein